MGRRIAGHDWSVTPLGAPEGWPQSLKTLLGLLLVSTQPMFVAWGPERTWLYNDAFTAILGRKHPAALGQPAAVVWAEAWGDLEPLFAQVFAGQPVHMRDFGIALDRRGALEEAHFLFSYSPIHSGAGGIDGLFGVCVETTEQVFAMRAMTAQRQQFAQLFEQAPTFMAMLRGPHHRFEMVNPGYRKLIGGREVVGLTVAEALPEAVDQGFLGILDTVFHSAEPFSATGIKYRMHGVPGSIDERFLDFVYQPIIGESGEVTGIFVEGVDATERVEAERRRAALARMTDRFAELQEPAEIGFAAAEILGEMLNASRVGYGTIAPGGDTLEIERAWAAPGTETITGSIPLREYGTFIDWLRRGELIVIPDIHLDARVADAIAALQSRGVRGFVDVPIIEQGELVAVLYVNDAEVRDWRAEDLALVREAAARTRTAVERARAAVALKDREAELRSANETLEQRVAEALAQRKFMAVLVDMTETFIQALDTNYRFLAINKANADEYFRAYGVRPALGDSLCDVLADRPDVRDAALAIWGRAMAGESFTEIAGFGDPPREKRYFEMTYRPLLAPDGTQIGAYRFSYDVTERLREQARLAEAEEQLRQSQKMEAVGQLTGGLAHDFNNLLAGISGSLELIERRIAEGRLGGLERFIAIAQGASRRAANLTQRLLAFSRRQTLDPKPTDMNRLIAGIEDLIRRSVGPNIAVEVVGSGGLWLTRVDPSQLENSLLNLCLNARDAMAPSGGRLTIETSNKWLDERAAQERELPPGQYVSLCVTDTGTGMSPEVIARAFDPFFTTKPLGEGTGLGLSMVHGFVRQSGGQVRIYSEIGKGTTMCLYLPRHSGGAEAEELEITAPADAGAGETVLVIDDEQAIRMLLIEVLEENGYAVIEAADGPSGLRVLQSDARVDLLITDVGLPGGLNGRQVADAARVTRPGLKVLFITGYAENAAIGNGHLAAGMEVMTKPFVISAFATKVRDLIDR